MDIEGFVRRNIDKKGLEDVLAERILEFKDVDKKTALKLAEAVIEEVNHTLKIEKEEDQFLKDIIKFPKAGITMGEMGVGSRGAGDFFVHRRIADIVSSTNTRAYITPSAQDDGGVIKTAAKKDTIYITTAVDGIHSRLSEYPFLGGFHVTRAALRDVCVMGSKPLAILSDLHLADDGDLGKLLDFTAGVAAVSELVNVPIVAGSTLRVGGDMVLGDRLVSAVGAIGVSEHPPTARKRAEPGDTILLTEGSGGGTITTTAIYHGLFDVVWETMDINFIKASEALMEANILGEIHAMTDVTNGGLRGDAHEISSTTGVGLEFYEDKIMAMINPKVLKMLRRLDIDPLGVSIDSLMIIAPKEVSDTIKDIIEGAGVKIDEIGEVTDTGEPILISEDGETRLEPAFREAAYTKIKKVVGEKTPEDFDKMKKRVEKATSKAIEKKRKVVEAIRSGR
ncbi:MAG TPA: AIR synthase-related protein [Methanothermobacter sp.]|nr:AIR synthase-related protein [Methanothermobacter sp.]